MEPIDERNLDAACVSCTPRLATPISRRAFLRRAAILSASGIVLLSPHAWAARTLDTSSKRRLIVVFLRGAVDGLNVVVPHGESAYYDARPTIALGRMNQSGGVIGTLAEIPGTHTTTEALSLGPTVPRILSGPLAVANIPLGRAAARPLPMDRPIIETAFDRLYTGNDSISRAYRGGRESRKRLISELTQDMAQANAGAPSPQGFSDDTDRLAHLIGRDPTIRVAFMALGGWDTHVNEGAANGQLAGHLKPLGEGLASLAKSLGPSYQDTVILVISEFGRTMHENGNGGTDHGHGNVMWVMGGPVKGRNVYGKWPGLATADLYQERDLAVTTDFREPVAAVLRLHLQFTDAQIARVFPARPPATNHVDGLISI